MNERGASRSVRAAGPTPVPGRILPIEHSRPFEVGVLLVHGIGQQREGETLSSIGGPLTECLHKYLARLSGTIPTKPRRHSRVELSSVQMDKGSPVPVHSEITLHNVERLRSDRAPQVGTAARWLLAEAWWAESFPPPSYRQILHWLVSTFPITMVSHFDRRLRWAWFQIRNPENFASRTGKILRLVRAWISLLLGILVLPPLLCLLVLVLVVGLFRVPFMGPVAQWIQRLLAATVGDSYILLSNPVARAAITGKVHRDLEWLSRRCERVAVVAHSQGGAIAHEVFRNKPLVECDLLVTYGSGLQKLALIEQMKESSSPRMHFMLWSAIFGLFAASVSIIALLLAPALVGGWLPWFGLTVFAAATGALAAWMRRSRRFFSYRKQWEADQALFNTRFRLPCEKRVRWSDVVSSDDPVPNGPLLDEYRPRQLSQQVVTNFGSALRDHTSYWQSSDDFVPRLVYTLLRLGGIEVGKLDLEAEDRQDAASLRGAGASPGAGQVASPRSSSHSP